MSNTERRNGRRVERAFDVIAAQNWHGVVTVGELCRATGYSRPTVKKYLAVMEQHGLIIEQERDMRYCAHNTPRTFRKAEV